MNIELQTINIVIPLSICAAGMLPFILIPSLRKADEDMRKPIYYGIFSYLLLLVLTILTLIIIESIKIMSYQNGARSLFICAILLIACIDKAIDFSPSMVFIKANLAKRLLYFVAVLCSIPLIWQILMSIVPTDISNRFGLMSVVQVLLMLIMFSLGVINKPSKKPAIE
jgi:hypothetical protein